MSASRIASVFALALVGACSSSGDDKTTSTTDAGTAAAAMPCEVSDVLVANCQKCHSDPPVNAAPMPLVSLANLAARAKSDPSKTVAEMMKVRINQTGSSAMPPPSSGQMPKADLDRLNAWLDKGAPGGPTATCGDGGVPKEKVGPEYLSCPESERVSFVAHGDGGAKFTVPADAGNLNECFYFKAPFEAGAQATAFAPILDDKRVVHHWILFETGTPQVEGSFGGCKMPLDARFITGWAPGGGNNELPADVGLLLPGKERWLILQLHYWNVAGYTDAKDASGVALCVAKTPRKNSAAISTLGSLAIDVPAKTMGTTVTGMCTPDITEPVTILSASPHMHGRGRALKTEVLRGGDPSKSEIVVDEKAFDFNAQGSHRLPTPLVVQPGDKLKTTCIYDNPGSLPAYFGEKTEDEMCFDFVLAYPATGLANVAGKSARRCIDK